VKWFKSPTRIRTQTLWYHKTIFPCKIILFPWLYSPWRTLAASHIGRRFLELFRHMAGLLGRVISPSQGLYLHRTTQHRNTRTNIHALSGIRTHELSNQTAKTHASDRTATVRIYYFAHKPTALHILIYQHITSICATINENRYNLDYWVFGLYPSSGILVEWLRLAVSNGPNRIGAPSLTPEDANRSGLKTVVCFLECQTMDKVQKLSNPDCNTPSSVPFRIDMKIVVCSVSH
jgi:hypothetical protein